MRIVLLFLLMLFTFQVDAADKYFFGGMNVAQSVERNSYKGKSVSLPIVGINAGVLFEKPSNAQGLSFSSGFIWMNKGSKEKDFIIVNDEVKTSTGKYRMNILDIPFLVKWSKTLSNQLKFHISSGPGLGFELFTRSISQNDDRINRYVSYTIFFELDYWLIAGIDYRQLSFRIFSDFGLVTPVTLFSSEPSVYRNRVFGCSVGYLLPDIKGKNQQEFSPFP